MMPDIRFNDEILRKTNRLNPLVRPGAFAQIPQAVVCVGIASLK